MIVRPAPVGRSLLALVRWLLRLTTVPALLTRNIVGTEMMPNSRPGPLSRPPGS